jgi:putative peptidoglycan lipid II flippase
MSRPTRPAGEPPFPDDEEPQEAGQPRFTPREQPYPPPPPPAQQPYDAPPPPHGAQPWDAAPPPPQPSFRPAQPGSPQGGPQSYPPPPPPPPGGARRGAAQGPSFTPYPPAEGDRQGPRHGRGRGRPRPSFTPREDHVLRESRQRPSPAPTAFLPPVPAGYPQPSFQPFDFPDAPSRQAPRFVPADRAAPQGDQDNRTRVLEPDTGLPSTGPQRAADTSPNLARSSTAMALGTVASRGTGFLRTFVLLYALGLGTTANAYNTANTLPNTIYYLMLGGVFTSVVVPMLVRAAKEDPDRGEGYARRIYSFGVVCLLLVTVVATLFAQPIASLYGGNLSKPNEYHLTVVFAYFFIAQIFFYGMDSLLGAILNVRGRFGANMWTPVINNVVVILVVLIFLVTVGKPGASSATISGYGVALLGIGTTLGIVIQSIALFPVMWRAGFSMRLVFDFRRAEIGEIGRTSGWMFGYVFTQWLGNLVVTRVANSAPASNGISAYANAYQLFQLPYAIVGISVISALLPRMSGHANDRRYSLVRDDFSKGVRLASVIVVPAAVFLAVLGSPLCEFLFAHGHQTTVQDARYIGEVFGAFCLGLLPFMLTQLQLRVFYSFHESKTPAVIGMLMLVVGVIGYMVARVALPPPHIVIGLAFAFDIMTLAGAIIAWPLLLRRVGSLDGWRITRSLVRMFLATLPGLLFAFVVMAVAGSFLHQGPAYGLAVTVVGGGGALLLYALCCRIFGIEEYRTLMRTVLGRFG